VSTADQALRKTELLRVRSLNSAKERRVYLIAWICRTTSRAGSWNSAFSPVTSLFPVAALPEGSRAYIEWMVLK